MRLRAAALERLVQLDDDSALVLYRVARAADPSYFLAHYEYIALMRLRYRGPELKREYQKKDSSSALTSCLAAAAELSMSPSQEPTVARLKSLELRYGPSQCTDALLVNVEGGYSEARGARAIRDSPELAEVWSAVAREAYNAGQAQSADRLLRAGIKATSDPLKIVGLTRGRINQHVARGDTAGVLALWRSLAADVRRDGRPGPLAAYYSARCVSMHAVPGATRESRAEDCRQLNALVRPRRAWQLEWITTRQVGQNFVDQGELKAAIPAFTRAVQLADSVGSAGMQLMSYTLRGRAFSKAGNLSRAFRDLEHAIALGPAADEPYLLADTYHNLAHTYEGMGRLADAAVAADSYAVIAAPMRHSGERWMSRRDAGLIRWKAGWHAAATRDFEAMVRFIDELNSDGHYFAGEYFERIGDLGRALEYYRLGAKVGSDARNLTALSRVYEALGLTDSAESTARRHDADTKSWSILERPLRPDVLARRGRVAEAIPLADAWARRMMAGGNVQGAALAQLRLATLLLLNHQPKAAYRAAVSADSLSRLLQLTAETIEARTLLGRALVDQGMHAPGLVVLRDAVRLATAHPSTNALLSTNLALGNALTAIGRRPEALTAYDRAGTAVERMTAGLVVDTDRAGFKSLHLAPFDGALRILLRSDSDADIDAALNWSVRRKAAALRLAGDPGTKAPRRQSIGTIRDRLRGNEAIIDYSVIDSTVAAIVVRRQYATRIPLAVSASRVATWIDALRRPLVTTPGGRVDLAHSPFNAAVAESLFNALIAPLGGALNGTSLLAIVPDGALWHVPFGALVTGQPPASPGAHGRPNYLIERHEVRLLPSALFFSDGQREQVPPPDFRVDAFTYSVPGDAAELAAIRAAVGSSKVLAREGSSATERAARIASADILHLAVHGVVDDRDPLASHLRFAPEGRDDGLLHLSEVTAQRVAARLVVLTACEAVNGKLYAGEGLAGLARAFLVSGARHVVASQWPVDASAAELTGVFYRELARGQGPSASLRTAQLALLRKPGTAHPIHWAGFVAFDGGGGRPRNR